MLSKFVSGLAMATDWVRLELKSVIPIWCQRPLEAVSVVTRLQRSR